MTSHLKFRIGEKWICIEDGNGYAPDHPDHVTFAVRDVKANGKPGGRVAAHFSVRWRTVLEIGLQLLEHCDDETAAGLHVLVAAADQTGGFPARPIVGFDAAEFQVDSCATSH